MKNFTDTGERAERDSGTRRGDHRGKPRWYAYVDDFKLIMLLALGSLPLLLLMRDLRSRTVPAPAVASASADD